MSINVNDYVYIPSRKVYGKVDDICNVLKDVYYEITIFATKGARHEKTFLGEDDLIKIEVPNFKAGDIVTGLKGADAYVVTTDKAVMKVMLVREESMTVKILSHGTRPHSKGSLYTVDPIWFKLARPRTNFYRGEKED